MQSQLLTLSMRRTVLSLLASRAVSSRNELTTFFENALYWHEILENSPRLLEAIVAKALKAVEWLLENRFVEESHSIIHTTPLGKCTSLSGLLPETAKRFVDLLGEHSEKMQQDFGTYEIGLIHWATTCSKFSDEHPSRFLPWTSGSMKPESPVYMERVIHLTAWDRTNEQVTRSVHALGLFIQGLRPQE